MDDNACATKIGFLLDRRLLEINDQLWLPTWLQAEGHKVVAASKPGPLEEEAGAFFSQDECLVIMGSIPFTRYFQKLHSHNRPGAYFSLDRFRCSQYLHQIPRDWLLNADHVYAPLAEILRKPDRFFELFDTPALFLRPDSGTKAFTGLVVRRETAAQELSALVQLTNAPSDSLTLISRALSVQVEYRFVIVNRKVISGSRYMTAGEIDISDEIDPNCQVLAERMAKHPYQVELAYTCDIGLCENEPKLIELNALSTSGLYACDVRAVYSAIAEAAWLEHQMEISIGD